MKPVLYIVIPCYNEQAVLPKTAPVFLNKLLSLIAQELISDSSKIQYINDGSSDNTWDIICSLAKQDKHNVGICLSKNRGHQNALLAGLMDVMNKCDAAVSLDCDGQDDIDAIDKMIAEYTSGKDIVYGVRSDRKTDSFFKRFSAELYYKLLNSMGARVVFNHADYRLLSNRVLCELSKYREVNLFLRGIIPLIGFKSSIVYYERKQRVAGETHYPLGKMVGLALDGITSTSVKPLHIITGFGVFVAVLSFIGVLWSVIANLSGQTIPGWTSMTCIICFIGGVQLISIGALGEYIGKIYMEVKGRPRYVISERTDDTEKDD